MIIGTGIDIVDVARIHLKLLKESGFKEKVFSQHEIQFCENAAHPAEHYAARFAAKEAFLKSTGLGMNLTFDLFEIEVVSGESGKPSLNLTGHVQSVAQTNGWNKFHVSLSHVQALACAVVIIES